jgi:hypothetical protein
MAKTLDDTVLDGALNIFDNGNVMTACSTQPTTRTEAVTTYMLASTAVTAGTDYTIANGDTSGRKATVAAKNGVSVTNSGTALFVAICDATTLLAVTTCTSQALTSGNTVNFPAWKLEIADPT